MEFEFKIKGDRLIGGSVLGGNSGNVNTYNCRIDFEENTEFTWICVFKKEQEAYQQVIEDGKCVIPKEVLESPGTFFIGCYGIAQDKRISTNWLEINITEGAYCQATTPEEPTPDLWETLVMNSLPYVGENGNWYVYDRAKQLYKDSGKPARGEKGEKGDKGDPGNDGKDGENGKDGRTPQRGVDYWTEEDKEVVKTELEKKLNFEERLASTVGNYGNTLKGKIVGNDAVGITDISSVEHEIKVLIKSKNITKDVSYNDISSSANEEVIGAKVALYKDKTYTMSFDTENTGASLKIASYGRPIKVIGSNTVIADGTRKSITFAMTDDFIQSYRVTLVQLLNAEGHSGLCSNFQIEEGDKATPYTPCISNLSGVSLKKCGKNIHQITDKIASGNSAYQGVVAVQNLIPNVTYTLSADYVQQGVMSTVGISVRNSSGVTIARSDNFTNKTGRAKVTFTVPENGSVTFVFFSNITATAVTGTACAYSKMCLSVGDTNEEFEEYVVPSIYMPDENGVVGSVTAICPSTTLLSDNTGVIIDCEYNRDINKAYEELTSAIISLGGNV